MAHKIANRTKETSTTTGTGTYTLAGAATGGFVTFTSVLSNSDTTFYLAEDGTNYEIGIGTFTTSGTTLARTTILSSSNANAAVNWSAGTRNISIVDVANYTTPFIMGASNTNRPIQVADQTALSSAAGNARGKGAIDLGIRRSSALNVASGAYSVVIGGADSKASGAYSVAIGGLGSQATVGYATAVGGHNPTCSGTYAAQVGGNTPIVSGSCAFVGAGHYNTASGAYSAVIGGRYAKADKFGQLTQASGRFAATGDAQSSVLTCRKSTTDGTATELFTNGSSTRLTLSNNTAWQFFIQVIAWRTDAKTTGAGFAISGAIERTANAASTAIIGTNTALSTSQDAGALTWTATATADTTNGSLKITVTGEAAKTIQWVARVQIVETTG